MLRYKVVSLGIEYTQDHDRDVVVQFCVEQKVLLYYFSRVVGRCQRLGVFLSSEKYTLAAVDTANDKKVLKNSGLQVTNLVALQKQYRVAGSPKKAGERDSLEDLAISIIFPSYEGKKRRM